MVAQPEKTQTISTDKDRQLIDRIIYLASLVSDPAAVDPMLDALRLITSRMQPARAAAALSAKEAEELRSLETKLKDYLIHRDPVRSFSETSLDQELEQHLGGRGVKNLATKQLRIVIGITFLTYLLAVVTLGRSRERALLTMSPILLTLLNFGIAWFFWSARNNYAHDIRTMYGYFSTGVIIRSIALIQFPLILAIPALGTTPAFHYVGFLPPFILMSILFYWGMRLYIRQLKLATWVMSVPAVFGGATLLGIGVFLLSSPSHASSHFLFNVSLASFILAAYFSTLTTGLAQKVARHIASRYAKSMSLLAASQATFALGCLCSSALLLIVSGPLTTTEIGLTALSFAVPEILLLLSAYNAKKQSI